MITSWDDYKKWVSDLVRNNHTYFFRGQQDLTWKLETTFQRYAAKNGISWRYYFDKILPDVYYSSAAFGYRVDDPTDEKDVGGFLAKLQHHGFPTPLLDWTMSPYVAAYFALEDIDPRKVDANGNVKIYMFDFQLWRNSYMQVPMLQAGDSPFLSEFKPAYVDNQRLVSQMAVTTVTNVPDVELYLNNIKQTTGRTFLYYALLPIKERRLIMNELNLMGISSATMFPDFDGMCMSLKERHFNNIDPIVKSVPNVVPPPPPLSGTKQLG
ncbi:FRG domain-containing protein [Vibrio parahaemolyticus]|uniref:FRG domain-containing protein n=1 Tax=Vibrio parahaemolyticus TaxID=670 RepID=UPI001121F082|nr:FRG domain-containing protein [Vibrio parahaemolyticus]MDF4618627.1 FRG domain-containing protein [Vibrio parahaemolyticus]TOB37922.1 FRG domain-containing protein [Vibrio parahaemolyticus]HCG5249804.1 FRG domain-containing protein [Vibrio parahaemolyticus]